MLSGMKKNKTQEEYSKKGHLLWSSRYLSRDLGGVRDKLYGKLEGNTKALRYECLWV